MMVRATWISLWASEIYSWIYTPGYTLVIPLRDGWSLHVIYRLGPDYSLIGPGPRFNIILAQI